MPSGIHTRENNRGCRGYDPDRQAIRQIQPPKPRRLNPKEAAWERYNESTREMRGCLFRGSISEDQFFEFAKPYLRELTDELYRLTGIRVTVQQLRR